MAEQYGVSRNVIREALKCLHQQGYLRIVHGKGNYVKHPDVTDLSNSFKAVFADDKESLLQMLEVREILEMAVIEKAVMESDPADVVALEDIYDAMEQVIEDPDTYMKLDEDFHNYIYNIVSNKMLLMVVDSFHSVIREKLFRVRLSYPERIRIAQEDHYRMLEAFRTKDVSIAREAMQVHMSGLRHEIQNL